MTMKSFMFIRLKMQIFFLSNSPEKCAQMLCDKHCVKMPTETAQILATVWWNTNDIRAFHLREKYGLYKPFKNRKHPSILWTQASIANYKWVVQLLVELCKEFEHRYGHTHKCAQFIPLYQNEFGLPPLFEKDWVPMTERYQAITELSYKDPDPTVAYKIYYFFDKRGFAEWKKNRPAPNWWTSLLPQVLEIMNA